MSIDLSEYQDFLSAVEPIVRDTFDDNFHEASRVMAPRGLHNYLEGARALHELGRGSGLVVTYLDEMPAVAKEVGDVVIPDIVTGAMRLASMVSGEVIELLFASLPTAARRLGDPELLRQYLGLIHQLSAKAPRGLRPMLAHLDELLSKLTLGGLRRWAMWGAQAHGRDPAALGAYFGLASADSRKVLQAERRGTLFIDNQRKLNFYLRALWGRDFFMRPTAGDYERREGIKPYIEGGFIYIPDAYDDIPDIGGVEIYRATCAHAAAHIQYTQSPISAETLNPAQMFLIGLFEDARIERRAIAEFPGLKGLWCRLHGVSLSAEDNREGESVLPVVIRRLERLSYTLLAPETLVADEDPVLAELVDAFERRYPQGQFDGKLAWELGVTLYHRLRQTGELPSLRVLETMRIPYRDDNRYIWEFAERTWSAAELVPPIEHQVRRKVNVMEMVNEVDVESAGDDAQEIWTLETEFFRDGDPVDVSMNRLEGKEPVSHPYHYPEWDYQVQLYRPDWTTVLERRQPKGDPELLTQLLAEYRPVASRIRYLIDALIPQGVVRQRRQEHGDEIDLDAAIRAMIDLRMGHIPDTRINIRIRRQTRDLAVMVLLDLSESTNETLAGSDRPVLQLTREACTLLAWAMDAIGDPFAIHGFASDTRHDVQYYRFKDFDQPFDDQTKARLAGMQGGLSTRMGAALRHAATYLLKQPQQKKLLLLVSDGEPADIDVRDPQYLRHDTKKAVEELARNGISNYCLTLDPEADHYVSRIFGPNGFTIVDHVQRLPERLPTLFAHLTR